MRRAGVGLALWFTLVGAQAFAASVYLNGVRIDGVANQKFERATVRIDEKGDVHIDAPGYKAQVVTDTPDAGVAQLTKKYWLVTEQTAPGMAEYDIDVYANSKFVRKLRSSEGQLVMDITRHLVPGKNAIVLSAKKTPPVGSRKSYSPEHVFRVIIGEGHVDRDNVVIDNPIVEFKRSAADAEDISKEFSFSTR